MKMLVLVVFSRLALDKNIHPTSPQGGSTVALSPARVQTVALIMAEMAVKKGI